MVDPLVRRLVEVRLARKISQETLAKKAGVSRQCVLRVESGKQDPGLSTLRMIAGALGATLLLAWAEEPPAVLDDRAEG